MAVLIMELVGPSRPKVGLDTGSEARERWYIFLHMLKNSESNAKLKGLDLVFEHIQVNKASKIDSTDTSPGWIDPPLPC